MNMIEEFVYRNHPYVWLVAILDSIISFYSQLLFF